MKLPVLSYTFLRDYNNCPRKAWHLAVAKDLPKPAPTPEMQNGIDMHKTLELACKGAPYPSKYERYVRPLLPYTPQVELQLGMTIGGNPCSFWSKDVWLRGKVDVVLVDDVTAFIVDWKTGRSWEDPTELEIFSMLLQSHYPALQRISGNYVWLKEDKLGTLYDLSEVQGRWNAVHDTWDEACRRPLDIEWGPKPNKLCGWCPVKTCEHNTNENA